MASPKPDELKVAHDAGFKAFMDSPTTRLLFSMIPPAEPREVLATLIRSAFDAGTGFMVGEMTAHILKNRDGE